MIDGMFLGMEFDAVVETLVGRGFDLEEDFFEFEKPVDGDFGGSFLVER